MGRLRRLLVAGLCAVLLLAVGIAGCGGDDDSDDAALEERIAAERQDAAKEARQRERLKQLEGQVEELRAGSDGTSGDSVDTGSSTADLPFDFGEYVSVDGGWGALVPVGGGWSEGVEVQENPDRHRTTFTGPGGAVLIIDSTPSDAPAFEGDAPRSTVAHPSLGSVTKLVFRGGSTIGPCETAVCVDYLIPAGSGGFAVLAGGPGNFSELEAIAETVMMSLRPLDT